MEVYTKILTETDVSTRLAVETRRLNEFFPAFQAGRYHQDLVVEDENGAEWIFVLQIRREQHRRPVVSQGSWLPFVVNKQARVGDQVVFSKERVGATGSASDNKKFNLFDIERSKFIKPMEVYPKILTETDVSTRLAVGSDTIDEFFPAFDAGQYSQILVLEDENGEQWPFRLSIRQGPQRKPTISAGWRRFVMSKQAKVGDQVVFSKERVPAIGSACRYKIRVVKQAKLFNAYY